jgi:glycosyltransferase involved in cell wall biosynthesis
LSKKKLHILFLNSWYPSKVFTVNGDFIQRHAQAVAERHHVTAIHIITDSTLENDKFTEQTVENVHELIYYLKPRSNVLSKTTHYFKAFQTLLKKVGYFDIVHVNRLYPAGLIALYIKYRKKCPYIISEHFTGYLESRSKTISFLELYVSKLIVKHAYFVCPVSENLAMNMRKIGLKGNYEIVPNVVDTNLFVPAKRDSSRFIIVHVSSLVEEHKNIKGLLNAIRKFQDIDPDFLFYLIGDNPSQYQNYIENLDLNPENYILINQVSHQEIASYLKKADALVLFSNYENLPCVILEAFASGVQVISTDVGGISEFFPKDFGILISPKDETQLVQSLLEIQNNSDTIDPNKMHQYAVEHFSKEKIAKHFEKLYYITLKNET